MLADQLIHQQSETFSFTVQNHHDALSRIGARIGNIEHPMQFGQRQILTAHMQDLLFIAHGMNVFSARLQGFDDIVQRQDIDFIADLDRHAVKNRQRQRQHNLGSGAVPLT